ncbi:MAG: hypothetical protein IJC15_00035, partial [Clostridia bacterium]|nr:hypothetical protein [Clostridia bacterium]
DGSDVIGYFYNAGSSFSYHAAAMNLSLFPLAKDGTISFDPNVEKTQRVFEILMQLEDPSTSFNWATVGSSGDQAVFITNMMSSKQALFQTMILSQVRRLYPDVTANFGVLPLPKLDENQDTYHTTLNRGYTMVVTVPVCNPDLERTGFAIEAMAEASGELFDAYYEVCMGAKYTRDPQSYDMIKIARENVVYDPGFCYAWGNLYSTLDKLVKERNDAVASTLAEMTSVAEAGMKDYFEAIQKNS